MKKSFLFLLFFFLFFSSSLTAEEIIRGKIIFIDNEKEEITLLLKDQKELLVNYKFKNRNFKIAKGDRVYIRGDFSRTRHGCFMARTIKNESKPEGCRNKSCKMDSTGVRSRIEKNHRHGKKERRPGWSE